MPDDLPIFTAADVERAYQAGWRAGREHGERRGVVRGRRHGWYLATGEPLPAKHIEVIT